MDYNYFKCEILSLEKDMTFEKLEEIEKLLKVHLGKDSRNTDLWLRIAVLQLCPPLMDEERCTYYLEKILEYDKKNVIALLMLAYIGNNMTGGMSDTIFNALDDLQVDDLEQKSMIYYELAWYFYYKNEHHRFEKMLKLSIEVYPYHVNNYAALGKYYIRHQRIEIGKEMIKQALKNVLLIYSIKDEIAITDYHEFINENIKGVHITQVNFEGLKERLL